MSRPSSTAAEDDRAHLFHQVFHQGVGQVPERQRRQVGKAQVEDARCEAKELAVTLHITQRLQREQDAARPGAGQAGAPPSLRVCWVRWR